jgi:hypothetical protein
VDFVSTIILKFDFIVWTNICRVVIFNSAGKKNIFSISFITRVIYIIEKLFLLSGKEQTFLYRLV